MKRKILFWSSVLFILATALVSAQTQGAAKQSNSDFYVHTVYLNKVYPTKFGYIVAYVDSEGQYEQAYLPMSWFNTADGKGELLFGYQANYPYMNIYWRNGKFDHLQLFVDSNYQNPTWGEYQETPGLSEKFKVDTLKMKF